MKKTFLHLTLSIVLLLPWTAWGQANSGDSAFALRDGDRVVFFGDSITEQRLYTRFVEQYAITRFPGRNITFINSGVGGDKVSGGWAGPIDLRLRRDLFAYNPTVVTVMLGMNDGYYRASDEGILRPYREGYRQIVDKISAKVPNARLTLIKTSPYDDVTRTPLFETGYNAVLVQLGAVVDELGREKHATLADMNTPLVTALTTAKNTDPALAQMLIFDRVHPGAAMHWVMAAALLKAWNAPAIVSSVTIDASKVANVGTTNTEISELRKDKAGRINWVQKDGALPLPLPPATSDPILHLALQSSTVVRDLDQELLQVSNLRTGSYELRIDDKVIGSFDSEQLKSGINLATLETPMLTQARVVALDNEYKDNVESARFGMLIRSAMDSKVEDAANKLQGALQSASARQRADAQPVGHRFSLTRVGDVAVTVARY